MTSASTWTSRLLLGFVIVGAGCGGSFERRMEYARVDSPAMDGRRMQYSVYTPPGYTRAERLPLVVFLHGGGDDAASFDRAGLTETLDRATRDGTIPRVIIVVPQGDLGFWANWWDGSARYEDWVTEEVMPRVAYDYRTLPCPDYCHVMGVSMGGSGTLRFALHRDDLFSTATMISAPIMDTQAMIDLVRNPLFVPMLPFDRIFGPTSREEARERVRRDDPYLRWRSPDDLDGMRLMVAWGHEDRGPIISSSERFHRHLAAHGIAHEALEYDGNHSWASWGPVIVDALSRMVPRSPWAHPGAPATPGSRREVTETAAASR